ncbi:MULTISPECIES: hypothetical protein [Rhodococcus]|jgi:hypothetical protein|uniref:Uncharacterized protein n=2 Tax=Rhodococcus TaxID=1827 RepID=A0A1H7NH61_9NOCA|nr:MULTISPECIES: hypothetical protein [Rhodococcus]AQA20894.1 hypothetical protein BTZ20_4725 [Rhodococcus sp. MTM3W5.2]MBP1160358.1 hypothetical protein [Rhodococcus sp. PvR099]MCZ4556096.1 hypothetical protein [Rhodococcus maanshanensis]PTR36943.1 hypothetical protein C8K38_122107 [Rhodococcus sp. OK611]TJZ74330.1 hypothetical protein FCG67_21905 [Rhodococcus oryzae]
MKLRISQLSTAPPLTSLPADLTGHAVTLDLSHTDAAQRAAATDLARELLDRGAARIVISGSAA